MHAVPMFENTRLARMSDGHYCLVRDLGLVKGGKGLRCHEVVVDFSLRGMKLLAKQGAAVLAKQVAARYERRKASLKWPAMLRLREPR
jgi:hypothetical protein